MTDSLLYHSVCLASLLFLYIGSRGTEKKELAGNLGLVYSMTACVILCDVIWDAFETAGATNSAVGYIINILYFSFEILGIYFWFFFTVHSLRSILYTNRLLLTLMTVPAAISFLLVATTPFTGLVFTIENGIYVRGTIFYVDSALKIGYLLFNGIYCLVRSSAEKLKFKKKRDLLLGVYSVPVIVGGIIQAITSFDLNCVAPVVSFAILYANGLSNKSKEDGEILHSIAEAYKGAFIINSDTDTIRTLFADEETEKSNANLWKTNSFSEITREQVKGRVAPEDRLTVQEAFAMKNVLAQLESKKSYSVIYKTMAPDGSLIHNQATFMKAFSEEDRHLIFLGIDIIDIQQLLQREQDNVEDELERFENVKESFTNVIANIIEARDLESGEHVMRVKNYTQLLCNQVMQDYPEYRLDRQKIRYITSCSALHDIGKIMIPDSILLKPGRLTKEEFDVMKTHCEKGLKILDQLPTDLDKEYIKYAKEICLYHHEKYNGDGYIGNLHGDEIPISAQIVSIADCFDALTSKRVYKDALPKDVAYRMILNGECGTFNPKLINCFIKVYSKDIADN